MNLWLNMWAKIIMHTVNFKSYHERTFEKSISGDLKSIRTSSLLNRINLMKWKRNCYQITRNIIRMLSISILLSWWLNPPNQMMMTSTKLLSQRLLKSKTLGYQINSSSDSVKIKVNNRKLKINPNQKKMNKNCPRRTEKSNAKLNNYLAGKK